jgi:glucan phosphoethanolaminetransferase (alkaline phosphatase superfamily)
MHGTITTLGVDARSAQPGRTWSATFACALATTAVFYLPDAYLYATRGLGQGLTGLKYMPLMILLGLFITLVASRFWRLLTLAFAALVQLIWVGMFAYAGIAPSPSAVLFGRLQFYEVRAAIAADPSLLYGPAVIVALSFCLLVILQEMIFRGRVRRVPRWGFLGLLGLDAVIALLAGRLYADPDPHDTSLIGGYKMAVGSARLLIEPRLARRKGGPAIAYTVTPLPLPEEPVTVAFIMGESVSAERMGLFGAARLTTPRLLARAQANGPFKLFYKAGFSSGISTIGSVPNFVDMLYAPNDVTAARAKTAHLFRLADASGFTRYLYSSQATEILARTTDFKGFARFETGNTYKGVVTRRDDILVELLNATPAGRRQFFFLQQRVNHFPYMENCAHVPEVYRFDVTRGSADERRRAAYDNGLLCADRSLDALFEAFSKLPGAVYVFYTSDHGEMMGTDGLWGHSFTDLRVAQVPMLLFTNRPDAAIKAAFADDRLLSAFELARLTARYLGHSVDVNADVAGTFYVNGMLPRGSGGFLEVKRTADPHAFDVGFAGPAGRVERRDEVRLPRLQRTPTGE